MKRFFIGIGSVAQAILSVAAVVVCLGGASFHEIIPFALFLAAAAISLLLVVGDNLELRPVLFTVSLNALAIGVYCITPAFLGADAEEGLLGSMVNTPMEITRVNPPDQKQDGTPESD